MALITARLPLQGLGTGAEASSSHLFREWLLQRAPQCCRAAHIAWSPCEAMWNILHQDEHVWRQASPSATYPEGIPISSEATEAPLAIQSPHTMVQKQLRTLGRPRIWLNFNIETVEIFYSILFYSILFYSILFYSILFYSILFYSIMWGAPIASGVGPTGPWHCGSHAELLTTGITRISLVNGPSLTIAVFFGHFAFLPQLHHDKILNS